MGIQASAKTQKKTKGIWSSKLVLLIIVHMIFIYYRGPTHVWDIRLFKILVDKHNFQSLSHMFVAFYSFKSFTSNLFWMSRICFSLSYFLLKSATFLLLYFFLWPYLWLPYQIISIPYFKKYVFSKLYFCLPFELIIAFISLCNRYWWSTTAFVMQIWRRKQND